MIKYDRNRSRKILESSSIAFNNCEVHERAMKCYKLIYSLTKSKWAEKKFNEHKVAAICECSIQMGLLLNEIIILESLIQNED